MTPLEAKNFFGNWSAVARAMGISHTTVVYWRNTGDLVPIERAIELHVLSDRKLPLHIERYIDDAEARLIEFY